MFKWCVTSAQLCQDVLLCLPAGHAGVGAGGLGVAGSLGPLLACRVLYGLGIGFAMHAAPAYIAETSPPSVRGLLISLKVRRARQARQQLCCVACVDCDRGS